jgi:hypothetical protein
MANSQFEQLIRSVPGFGRAWLYLALTQLKLEESQAGVRLSRSHWQRIQRILRKAYSLESESAWMQYRTGSLQLTHHQFLSKREHAEAFQRVQRAVATHYANQSSPYLKPALTLLWKKFSDFDLLKTLTPDNRVSYNTFVQWIDQNKLWKFRDGIFRRALVFNRSEHDRKIREGLDALMNGEAVEAYQSFQEAGWIFKDSVCAKAGILSSAGMLGKLSTQYLDDLRMVLEEDEQDISKFLSFLAPVTLRCDDPYLKGLYAYRTGDVEGARKWFEIIPPNISYPSLQRYRADVHWKLQHSEKAAEILVPRLQEEDPDIRDIVLLSHLGPTYREQSLEKIRRMVADGKFLNAWWAWGKDFRASRNDLSAPGRIGQPVNLFPGDVAFSVTMRSSPDSQGNYGYLQLRLWEGQTERRLATVYVDTPEWKVYHFSARTSGGKRWLEFELMNATAGLSFPDNPRVEFKTVEVRYEDS